MSVDRPQGLIEGSGQRGEQRRLDQMVSARLDPMLVAAVKEYAKRHGVSVSDVFREAATQLLQREQARNVVTFRVDVTNETRPDGISRKSYQTDIPMAVLQASRPRCAAAQVKMLPRRLDPPALNALRSNRLTTVPLELLGQHETSVSVGFP
jgi:Ribbon-helix-helix protein, copG family